MQAKAITILQLIPEVGMGGAARVFSDHAALLSERFTVLPVVFNKADPSNQSQGAGSLLSLDVPAARSWPGKVINLLRRSWNLRRLVKRNHACLCISHLDGANWVNVISCGARRKILVIHGSVLSDKGMGRFMQFLRTQIIFPYVYNLADATVVVSKGLKHELTNVCGVKDVRYIPNFFDVQAIQTAADEELDADHRQLFAQHPVLITSGRLHFGKRQDHLLLVLNEVKRIRPDVKLVVLGDGPERENLLATARRVGLLTYHPWDSELKFNSGYDVYFLGYCSNPFKFLARSSLFLFPSDWEGFPMALGEAMVAGVAVLSSDCPTGPRELLMLESAAYQYKLEVPVATPYGMLMPMADTASSVSVWTETVLALLSDHEQRTVFVNKARERIAAFDRETVRRQWEELIQDLCVD